MLVLLLLVLRMLEGTCVVTFLPTNNAKIGGAEKSETKRGVTYSGIGFKALFFFFSFSFFFFFLAQRHQILEVAELKKKTNFDGVTRHCCIVAQHRPPLLLNIDASCSALVN